MLSLFLLFREKYKGRVENLELFLKHLIKLKLEIKFHKFRNQIVVIKKTIEKI